MKNKIYNQVSGVHSVSVSVSDKEIVIRDQLSTYPVRLKLTDELREFLRSI